MSDGSSVLAAIERVGPLEAENETFNYVNWKGSHGDRREFNTHCDQTGKPPAGGGVDV